VTLRSVGLFLLAIVVAGLLGWGLMTGLGRFLRSSTPVDSGVVAEAPPATAPAPAPASAPPAVPRVKATLFFASEDGARLVPVESDIPLAEGTVAQARALLEALMTAQAPDRLVTTIPPDSRLRGVYVSDRNEAFIDLDPVIRAKHPGGSMQELLTVYAIVNTLLVNLPTLEDVQLLIGGQEADTLAGHVDLRRPLRKNEALIQ
jgi:hypothetical protein